MVHVPKSFVDETLWPEFQKVNSELETFLQEVTDRVVKQVLHEDSSDAIVVDQPLRVGLGQSSISKDPITAEREKAGMPPDFKETVHPRKKKRKKKKRNR